MKLEYLPSAIRDLRALPAEVAEAFLREFELVAADPHGRHRKAKALKGIAAGFRLRIGDYRAIYSISRKLDTVVVSKVGHRREIYR